MNLSFRKKEAVELLKELIEIQSFSGEEDKTADLIFRFLKSHNFLPKRKGNNVWCHAGSFYEDKRTILLNSHHDTVKPGKSWTYDPFIALVEGDRLTGLGSNDAGASAVSLLSAFVHLSEKEQEYNLIVAITAEEENSGANNVASILDDLPSIDLGIVGEPTQMQMAVAERGLLVLDCYAKGKTGHAARQEGENAIYKAIEDMAWFRNYHFEKTSKLLGDVKMTVTQLDAGKQHNVVPDLCHFVVDVRVNENYSNEEIVETIKKHVACRVEPRSLRLRSSGISLDHPIVKKGVSLGLSSYGSPTLSDQSVMSFSTLKIGPGDSARSHTPDEYIFLSEIEEGIEIYVDLLSDFSF